MTGNINLAEYRDKVEGCWAGKNIGGTLGAPMEGSRELTHHEFYTQDLGGAPAPNDDLDLQLIWLEAIERHGLYNLTPRLMGEYWLGHIIGPWNEYSVCRFNCSHGFYPPLSGAINNERWKWSNGAWIRSEIWACLFPGMPDEAIKFAWLDASADHVGEGVYAEIFTAALEAAAFVEQDLRQLITIGLAKVPVGSRVARTVRLACDCYDKGLPWEETREAVVKDNADLGWFQAPGNLGFMTIGLLYGEGDFGKTILTAVNCGDDTDCTGATAGSIMGIMYGKKAIPPQWLEPIGDGILNVAVDKFGLQQRLPQTLGALTERTVHAAKLNVLSNRNLYTIDSTPTRLPENVRDRLTDTTVAERIAARNPYRLDFPLGFAEVVIEYEKAPEIATGESIKLHAGVLSSLLGKRVATFNWTIPEGWSMTPRSGRRIANPNWKNLLEFTLTSGDFSVPVEFLELEVSVPDHVPVSIKVPVQQVGAVDLSDAPYCATEMEACVRRTMEEPWKATTEQVY